MQFKKQSNWIQPNVEKTSTNKPTMLISYLEAAKSVPEAEIESWDDISRIDIRPEKGIAKIRSNNHWEIQIDSADNKNVIAQFKDAKGQLLGFALTGQGTKEKQALQKQLPAILA